MTISWNRMMQSFYVAQFYGEAFDGETLVLGVISFLILLSSV